MGIQKSEGSEVNEESNSEFIIQNCASPLAPLFNDSQAYDIVFRDARFDKDGKLLRAAFITVFHNAVLVQDHVELTGPTAHKQRPPYQPHPERMPLRLQEHNYPVRFRNIWVRELGESQ
ncbi:MAG: DUF1080 domain-containing protein [Terriglobia bacterium]